MPVKKKAPTVTAWVAKQKLKQQTHYQNMLLRSQKLQQELMEVNQAIQVCHQVLMGNVGVILALDVSQLSITSRPLNILRENGVITLFDLMRLDCEALSLMNGMGEASVREIERAVRVFNLELK